MFKFVCFIFVASWTLISHAQAQSEAILKGSEIRKTIEFIKFFEANTTTDTEKYYNEIRKHSGAYASTTKVDGKLGLIMKAKFNDLSVLSKTDSCRGVFTTFAGANQWIFNPGNAKKAKEIISGLQNTYIGVTTSGLRSGRSMVLPTSIAYTMNTTYHAIEMQSGELAPLLEVISFPQFHAYALVYKSPQTEEIAGFELITLGNSSKTTLSSSPVNLEAEKEMKSSGNINTYFKCF
ncbi:MAG: hypothetical protein IPM97_00750 [Bdellovibrionaceae bacterium]|nr:hypothetical protein [Pseudobdellovibrionaceae bacterium]